MPPPSDLVRGESISDCSSNQKPSPRIKVVAPYYKENPNSSNKGKGWTRMKPRNFTQRILQAGLLALALNLIAVASASAKTATVFQNIGIKNFGQMDERFFRGAQPGERDYKDLAALGIKTIIDLRDDPTSYEKRDAEAAGMRYVNIPMSDSG